MRANDIYRVRRRDIPSKAAPAAFDGMKGHANQAIPHRADVPRAQGMNGVKIDVQNEFCVKLTNMHKGLHMSRNWKYFKDTEPVKPLHLEDTFAPLCE